MRWLGPLFLILGILAAPAGRAADSPAATPAATPAANELISLSYHEARDEVRDYPDPYAVDSSALVMQFSWLRANGYVPVRLGDVIAARKGGKPLPPKAVLLTFDDSYLSFYTRVYPLLREFRFPAVLGVVGSWIDRTEGKSAMYGEKGSVPDASFPTWAQLREVARSGLVEIASHSYDLHKGILANPQGNVEPAAITRLYNKATGRYESDASWRARVRADLARNSRVIEREIGRRPRAMVWPYGRYNGETIRIARELGMEVSLTLEEGPNTADVPLTELRRVLLLHNPSLAKFVEEVRAIPRVQPVRVMQVNLDSVYSPDAETQEANLSALLDRIYDLKPSHVYLQATTAGDGGATAAYFPNRHLPVRADLFNRVAWQISTRTDAFVFAAMPLTGFRLPAGHRLADRIAQSAQDAQARAMVIEIYEDLARHADFNGLLFQDDAPPAPDANPVVLIEFSEELVKRVRAFRAPIKTVRSLRADTSSDSQAEERFAQSLAAYTAVYDQVWVGATPPENFSGGASRAWLAALVARVNRQPGALTKTVFQLDSPSGSPQDEGKILAAQFEALRRSGAMNFGYYSDDFARPPLEQIAPAMSLNTYPK